MAKVERDQPLVPSVLDRLIDNRPDQSQEAAKARHQLIGELRQSIRRDLENLLNTRWRAESWPDDLTELQQSLVRYGIPDVSGAGADIVSERGRMEYLRLVQETIQRFEPRFKTVRVEFLQATDPLDRTLRFRIDAVMYAFPAPEPVVFDTSLEPATGEFSVEGAAR